MVYCSPPFCPQNHSVFTLRCHFGVIAKSFRIPLPCYALENIENLHGNSIRQEAPFWGES